MANDRSVKAEAGIAKVTVNRSIYPWATMKVGESFKTVGKEPSHSQAYNANEKYKPKEFSAGRDAKKQCRIWRDK